MRKFLLITTTTLLLASCVAGPKPLYNWDRYENVSYSYLKTKNDKTTKALLEDYKKMMAKPNGSRKVVPPGVNADYGFMLIQLGKTEEGRTFLEKEIKLYPESKIFIDRILLMTAETKWEI